MSSRDIQENAFTLYLPMEVLAMIPIFVPQVTLVTQVSALVALMSPVMPLTHVTLLVNAILKLEVVPIPLRPTEPGLTYLTYHDIS